MWMCGMDVWHVCGEKEEEGSPVSEAELHERHILVRRESSSEIDRDERREHHMSPMAACFVCSLCVLPNAVGVDVWKARTKELSEATRTRPTEASLWLQYLDFQAQARQQPLPTPAPGLALSVIAVFVVLWS